jgi:hypothetical protein
VRTSRNARLLVDHSEAERIRAQAADSGVELSTVDRRVEREGVASFRDSYRQSLDCIQTKLGEMAADHEGSGDASAARTRAGGRAPGLGPVSGARVGVRSAYWVGCS